MLQVRVWIHTDKVGSECSDVIEFEREAWDKMSPDQREQECRDAAFSMMDWNYEVQE
nr:MAG TPA: hypothetical protein [Caudoviricetes sp.]